MASPFGNRYKQLSQPGNDNSYNDNAVPINTKNPYTSLIARWDFTRIRKSTPFIGRTTKEIGIDLYYVDSGYVSESPERYEEVIHITELRPLY